MKRKTATDTTTATAPKGKRVSKTATIVEAAAAAAETPTETPAEALPPTEEDGPELLPLGCEVVSAGKVKPHDLIIDQSLNMRKFSHTPANIQKRANSLRLNGQAQPIRCDEHEGKLRVRFGFLRALAGQFLVDQGIAPNYQLRYELVKFETDTDAMLNNLSENLEREQLTDIDLYNAFSLLKKSPHNLEQKAIASRLGLSTTLVSRVMGMKNLTLKEQKLVSTGTIPTEHARELATMDAEARKPFVAKLEAGDPVTIADIKAAQDVKKPRKAKGDGAASNGHSSQAADGDGDGTTTRHALSVKAAMHPFEVALAKVEDGAELDAVQVFAKDFIKYRNGGLKPGSMMAKLYGLARIKTVPSWVGALNRAEK